ncbi:uncharacterized protein N7446_009128 [Penicillium canescens]|uniref:uncharacterized protein n=1 Tax=Penicillium canescens TaxID=5083 RepID=UPI0026E08DAE|nr:uncharacterized protein N7446_009128 [Penicillium canescens]KAJ6053116.1 hypothetical protein N7446_009128 [Penicillium canescens]
MDEKPPMTFNLLGSAAPVLAPRVGQLSIPGRKAITTPHHVPLTSRGTVPHIAHDVMRDHTAISNLYIGLEDFIERSDSAPVYKTPAAAHESPPEKFTCLPNDMPVFLGPRRFPAIVCPPPNTSTSIALSTSIGFRQLPAKQYVEAVQKLRPDIAIGMADLRREKMVDRTHAFTRDALEQLYGNTVAEKGKSKTAFFAPVLPLDNAQQSLYLEDLESEFRWDISGLALYQAASLEFIPASLGDLPRLLFSNPATPHDILREISLGADLLTTPVLGASSDAGIALDFKFPPPVALDCGKQPMPLGADMWSAEHATDVSPLAEGCVCYACQKHHRAYFHHLLAAKEMSAWALLQIHNYHVLDLFFAGVRESIQHGTFEQDVEAFARFYASEMPESSGQGPRLRGYQLPAPGAHQPRRTPKVYGRLEEVIDSSSVVTPDTDASGLEEHGFAQKA